MQENILKKYNFFNLREVITEISNDFEKLDLSNLTSLKIYAYEKNGYSHKKHYCGYGSEYVFVVTVQNSFIAYAERNENTNEI